MFIEYLEYQSNKKEVLFEKIINDMTKIIKNESLKVLSQFREDLKQELLMKLFKILQNEFITINDDFKILDIDNSLLLDFLQKENNYIIDFNNNYLKKFYINILMASDLNRESSQTENLKLIKKDFYYFVGEIKIRKYLRVVCINFRIDFNRRIDKYIQNCNLSLNCHNDNEIEYLDLIADKRIVSDTTEIPEGYQKYLTIREQKFIKEYIQFENQKAYAEHLGVSQQYISKKLKIIRNRLREQKVIKEPL
ncbi:MAG: hypothetical protein KQ78_01560 [Candidatus Izimaplasma bacterium HR2]|nr:MAG: hypothetical protein KQ78_01560 [Candidatus Izimaplasma bacterium HR2]